MRNNNSLLKHYVFKEYFKAFLASFFFFYVIFFINTILLLVQKILLKNVNFILMMELVTLYMPQFLIFTFPFATLTTASMVLGDMASSNEMLALRSVGIKPKVVYKPIIIMSIILSFVTFLIADVVTPYSSKAYKEKLALVMADYPTMEIETNSINNVGSVVMSNGKTDGNTISDIILFTKNEKKYNKTIVSDSGSLLLEDPFNFVYSFNTKKPNLLISSIKEPGTFISATGDDATFYLDFSSQLPSLTQSTPVNLSSKEILEIIKEREEGEKKDKEYYWESKERNFSSLSEFLKGDSIYGVEEVMEKTNKRDASLGKEPSNYYTQYYKSELTKKIALSSACFFLSLLALPLAQFRIKHGKLIGFFIAIIFAVIYWYLLFASQLVAFDFPVSPYFIVMAPNILMGSIALILLYFRRRNA